MKSLKCPNSMDIIFPSVLWTLKPLCPKKLVFALANAIDTDQGNPACLQSYTCGSHSRAYSKLGLGPAILRTISSSCFLNQVPIILSVSRRFLTCRNRIHLGCIQKLTPFQVHNPFVHVLLPPYFVDQKSWCPSIFC
jgi:hypothetical protein